MDQRTDTEHRLDAAPGHDIKPAIGKVRKAQPWLDRMRRRRRQILVITALIIAGIVATVAYSLNTSGYKSTDDAFIDARTVSISAQVGAAIVDVPVTDNQLVEAGAVLVRLDDRDFRAQVDQAGTSRSGHGQHGQYRRTGGCPAGPRRSGRKTNGAVAGGAHLRATTGEALHDARPKRRRQRRAGPAIRVQSVAGASRLRGGAGQRRRHEKQLPVLKAQREVAQAQLEQAHAAREQADANLSRTLITAPVAGRVTRLTAAKGNYAAVGQALMMFVPREVWVTANFKETQLLSVRPGDPVDIRVDTYPHRVFKGHVDSIQAGSGTAFSLLPAENATGNFVKIVQRVPVKIVFDEPPDVLLGPGMSVVPTVRTK